MSYSPILLFHITAGTLGMLTGFVAMSFLTLFYARQAYFSS